MSYPAREKSEDPAGRNVNQAQGDVDSLLTAYAQAAARYSAAVQTLSQQQEPGNCPAAVRALDEADDARSRCEQVRLAVQRYFSRK